MLNYRSVLYLAVIACIPIAAIPAHADDDDVLFEGLVPGQMMSESEFEDYYGKGVGEVTFNCAGGGCVLTQDGPPATQDSVLTGTVTGNRGIVANQQFSGDHNNVSVNVEITVNLNTVTVTDSVGSSVNVTQSLDFSGVAQGFAP